MLPLTVFHLQVPFLPVTVVFFHLDLDFLYFLLRLYGDEYGDVYGEATLMGSLHASRI